MRKSPASSSASVTTSSASALPGPFRGSGSHLLPLYLWRSCVSMRLPPAGIFISTARRAKFGGGGVIGKCSQLLIRLAATILQAMSRAAVATSFFLASLTALMLFAATPVAAGDWEDASAAYPAGDYPRPPRLRLPVQHQQTGSRRERAIQTGHSGRQH